MDFGLCTWTLVVHQYIIQCTGRVPSDRIYLARVEIGSIRLAKKSNFESLHEMTHFKISLFEKGSKTAQGRATWLTLRLRIHLEFWSRCLVICLRWCQFEVRWRPETFWNRCCTSNMVHEVTWPSLVEKKLITKTKRKSKFLFADHPLKWQSGKIWLKSQKSWKSKIYAHW